MNWFIIWYVIVFCVLPFVLGVMLFREGLSMKRKLERKRGDR